MKILDILLIVVLAGVFCCRATADTVTLKQGQSLTGQVLKETDTEIFIDIGVDVLKIAKDDVQNLQYAGLQDSNDQDSNEPVVSDSNQLISGQQLYCTINAKPVTLEQCVNEVSQAVVKVQTPAGLGSGFFLNKDGHLITNYHVIENETKIEVTVFQKTKRGFDQTVFKKVEIQAVNPFVDLALLKVDDIGDTEIKCVPLGDIDDVKIGQTVFAIGNPLGLERTVTNGVISTKNRAFEGLVYLQTDTAINPGNSGGPLFNLSGQVIGVTNMGYIFFGGLGFAIPVDYVKHFVENRSAFVYDKNSSQAGYKYLQPDKKHKKAKQTNAAQCAD